MERQIPFVALAPKRLQLRPLLGAFLIPPALLVVAVCGFEKSWLIRVQRYQLVRATIFSNQTDGAVSKFRSG